jgi:quinone-modifying oxidoreductase subunit QmoB
VQQIQIAISEFDKLPQIVKEFVERVQEIGPNPFKGM